MSPEALLDKAREAAASAYAPYSSFPVGCALLLDDGRVITGCNVENASYGLTLCAERGAVSRMIIDGGREPASSDAAGAAGSGRPRIVAAAIAGLKAAPCYPCGACRQVLHEFDCERIVVENNETEKPVVIDFAEILPHAFGPNDL
ncbi:cytidine deaminase [Corynebacterium falsenii DSM 44353]|uniref:cytidine deaminase n=1 Tax=Corynebacterium falsenii TaxID=108486 RepID=UPI0003E94A00|nr:cytidine deaminase [Corynebacterium falsenii]AHI03047.1 cytidine deaminase [Corynebacterium falsenii DSM 44353]UBI03760.1 cytidine deaminase [Corynebacterium falsenii]UBI06231.1 cytidine deaminase [Corynebacterium falsenii]